MKDAEPLIPKYGGYRKLKSFRMAQLVHDVTVLFCDRFVEEQSRTHDHMLETARIGAQKIAEGSVEGERAKKSELTLTKHARTRLEELRRGYENFLRQQQLPLWDAADTRRAELVTRRPRSMDDVAQWVEWAEKNYGQNGPEGLNGLDARNGQEPEMSSIQSTECIPAEPSIPAEIMANGAITLIAMALSLLDRQVSAQTRVVQHEARVAEKLRQRRLAEWPE